MTPIQSKDVPTQQEIIQAKDAFKVDTRFPVIDTLPETVEINYMSVDDFNTIHAVLSSALTPQDTVSLPREVVEKVQEALSSNWFSDIDGESYNNDDIIEADKLLSEALLRAAIK